MRKRMAIGRGTRNTIVSLVAAGGLLAGVGSGCSATDRGQQAAVDEGQPGEVTAAAPVDEDPTAGESGSTVEAVSMTGAELLDAFGAEGANGVSDEEVAEHHAVFERIDTDGDGVVTADEYVAAGHFPEPTARLINAGQDFDGSGAVTVDEYVEHRIQTDEGKEIHASMDADGDEALDLAELQQSGVLSEDDAGSLFRTVLDADGSATVTVPEWLGAWGAWVWGEWIGPDDGSAPS